MLKNLTFIAAACLFATTGCTLTIGGGTDSDSDTASSTDASAGSTSASTSGGSTSDGSGSTSESPTTTAATTTAATSSSTTDASGTGSSSGGMSAYGMCGWSDAGYYACAPDGVPGAVDPNATNPIDCPDPLPAEGDKCDEMGPITGQGCCLPDGSNYYCDNNGQITKEACGA